MPTLCCMRNLLLLFIYIVGHTMPGWFVCIISIYIHFHQFALIFWCVKIFRPQPNNRILHAQKDETWQICFACFHWKITSEIVIQISFMNWESLSHLLKHASNYDIVFRVWYSLLLLKKCASWFFTLENIKALQTLVGIIELQSWNF